MHYRYFKNCLHVMHLVLAIGTVNWLCSAITTLTR